MTSATAYRRHDGWYLHAYAKTSVGLSIGTPPYMKLDNNVSAEVLGDAVIAALNGPKPVVPHPRPDEAEARFEPMFRLAGVKTWAAFAKRTSSVALYTDYKWLIIEPWENAGTKMGFVPIPGKSIKIPLHSSPAEIGEALMQAMAMCPER